MATDWTNRNLNTGDKRITEAGDYRITEDGSQRITQVLSWDNRTKPSVNWLEFRSWFLLKEDGSALLLESGGMIMLETQLITNWT